MPYIDQAARPSIDTHVEALDDGIITVGDLNYAVTRLALRYLQRRGFSYTQAASVFGTINEAVHEMRRRLLAPYEDSKIRQNGDVQEYQEIRRNL